MNAAAPEPPRYLFFGISFLVVYGLGSVLLIVAAAALGKVPELRNVAPILTAVALVMLAYTGIASFFCFMRNSAGLWMGLVLVGLGTLGGLMNIVTKPQVGSFIGFIINAALLGTCIFELRQYFGYRRELAHAAGYGARGYGMPAPPYGAQAYGNPAGAPYAPPPVDYSQPYRKSVSQSQAQLQAHAPQPGNARANALELLVVAASLEPDSATARLQRARTAALKLMGAKHAAEIEHATAAPANVGNPQARVSALGAAIASNAKLVEGLRKCLVFVLKDGDGLAVAAEQFLSEYDLATDNSVAS